MTSAEEPPLWQPGATVLEEFRVERHLGAGSFGQVSLVENRRSGERYAVKRLVIRDPVAQNRFLLEAQRWINLPRHPNIVTCYFVRTVGEEIAIFSEYVSGGSLADWIADRRMYADAALDRALRIAIQTAWGLDAAHRLGLLHLDVKPGNVLLTADGAAQVADFGLAAGEEIPAEVRVQLEAVVDYITDVPGVDEAQREVMREIMRKQLLERKDDEAINVAGGEGLSPAYSSPEQAYGRDLTQATDVYSWAVSMLEMFAGARTWPAGPDAGIALAELLRGDDARGGIPIPVPVGEVLRACLQTDASARPPSLGEVADRLVALYADYSGHALDISVPEVATAGDARSQVLAADAGISWGDPRGWLRFAYDAAGLDDRDAVAFWPNSVGTLKAQALQDLRALSEARRVLEPAAEAQGRSAVIAYGHLLVDIGRVRVALGDRQGAIRDYEEAVRVLGDEGLDAGLDESRALVGLAILLRGEERQEDSLAASGRAIELCRAAALDGDADARTALGTALLTDANTRQGTEEAIALHAEASATLEAAGDDAGLVRALAAQAAALVAAGHEDAEQAWKRADATLDRLLEGGRRDLLPLRALMLLNRASQAPTIPEQLRYARDAIEVYSPLVTERGMYRLAGEFGQALFFAARGEEHAGRPQEAVAGYSRARSILEDAVVRDGRSDLTDELAECYDHESTLLTSLGRIDEAVRAARRAVNMWTRVAEHDGAAAWSTQLATAKVKLVASLGDAGDVEGAMEEVTEAIGLLEGQSDAVDADGHRRALAGAYAARGTVLRRGGDLRGALESNEAALAILHQLGHVEDRRDEARILQNVGNVLSDAGEHTAGVDAVKEAIEIREGLGDDQRSQAELADAYHNLSNKLFKAGDYEFAGAAVERAVGLYEDLVDRGRTDIAPELSRLRLMQAMLLQRLFDPQGAIELLAAARETYRDGGGLDAETLEAIRNTIDRQVETIHELVAADAADVPRWMEKARESVERGTLYSQQGNADLACMVMEEAVGWLVFLTEKYPAEPLWHLCGETCAKLGLVAYSAGRAAVGVRGFAIAVNCFLLRLEDGVDSGRMDDLGKAYAGLAVLLATQGEDERADAAMAEMEATLRPLDPAIADRWIASTQQLRGELPR